MLDQNKKQIHTGFFDRYTFSCTHARAHSNERSEAEEACLMLGGLASSTSSVRVPRHDPSSVRAFRGVVHGSLGGVNAVTDVPIQESKLVTEITDTPAVGGL